MKKINFTIWILSVALVISTVSNIIIFLNYPQPLEENDIDTLKVGLNYGIDTLDPVDCWDRNSEDVINQVVETLFSNDLRDPKLPRINLLAESYYWKNNTVLHIKLREGILFHDRTAFNASSSSPYFAQLPSLRYC